MTTAKIRRGNQSSRLARLLRPLPMCGLLTFGALPTPANAMLRVWKYRPLTIVTADQICVFAEHEHNPLEKNRNHPTNGTASVVCRLSVTGDAGPLPPLQGGAKKTLLSSALQTFDFEVLTKTCVSFAAVLPVGYSLSSLKSLSTECTTAASAPRVFPGYTRSK